MGADRPAALVQTSRFLDGGVFAIALMVLSGISLWAFGQMYRYLLTIPQLVPVVDRIFPFTKRQFSFNLTHCILFAILICLLSMTHLVWVEDDKKDKKKNK
jgi:hypothetical protein